MISVSGDEITGDYVPWEEIEQNPIIELVLINSGKHLGCETTEEIGIMEILGMKWLKE